MAKTTSSAALASATSAASSSVVGIVVIGVVEVIAVAAFCGMGIVEASVPTCGNAGGGVAIDSFKPAVSQRDENCA